VRLLSEATFGLSEATFGLSEATFGLSEVTFGNLTVVGSIPTDGVLLL
jgi:hypothetical protein